MKTSETGKKLLAEWEGIELRVYKDVAGLPTIGIGHLLTKDELSSGKIVLLGVPVKYGDGLTQQQAIDLLAQDLAPSEQLVTTEVKVPLEQNQFDTLVAFAFNAGNGAFKSSTLLKVLNQERYAEVPAQLRRWIHAGGQVVRGLVARREKEITLWLA
jgi:lysozyme